MTQAPATMPELLPCPFCGGEALLEHGNNGSDESYDCHISCPNEDCVCQPSVLDHPLYEGGSDYDAICAWNTRAPPEAVQDAEAGRALQEFPFPYMAGHLTVDNMKREALAWIRKYENTIRAALAKTKTPVPEVVGLDEAIDITETRFYVESPRNPKERYAVGQVIEAARLYAQGHRAAPDGWDYTNGQRLDFIAKNGFNWRDYCMHVLRRGGDGDRGDFQSFIDNLPEYKAMLSAAPVKGDE